ncbi:MAG: molybdopterin molybdotransferase MoeA, partial [Anaerolineae bacterium]
TFGASASLPAYLSVIGETAMGQAASLAIDSGACTIVHTGGMIPPGTDAVVMVEHTERVQPPRALAVTAGHTPSAFPHTIEVLRPLAPGQNVIQVGEDVRQGEIVLAAGRRLRPADLGGLLAVGITQVKVAQPPRVAILSQGDEVVPPTQTPGPGQIRDINSYTLAALTHRAGAEPILMGIAPDQLGALSALARQAFALADVVVISAGSSVSVRDMTAEVIAALGQPGILVHGLSVRPGKPTILAVCDGKPVFGLPGNPVSAMVIFDLVVAPTLRLLQGEEGPPRRIVMARLARPIASVTGREDYVPVRLEQRGNERWAVPVFGKSNLIYTLLQADGAVRVALDSNGIGEAEWVEVLQ